MSELSVIVPAYNSKATLGRTLEGLLALGARVREIIVADSSDDPGSLAQLAAFGERGVRLVRLPPRTMPAIARNRGAAVASGTTLAFLDSDVVPASDWPERVDEARAAGCRAGGGALRIPPDQRRTPIAAAQYFLQFNEFVPAGRRRVVRFVPSANLFCEHKLFSELGGFPELRASEDVVFGLRVSEREKVWFDPAILADHVFRTAAAAVAQNQEMLGRYVYRQRAEQAPGSFPMNGAWPRLLWPAIAAAKGARIGGRVARTMQPALWGSFALGLPGFAFGLWHWGRGFAAGSRGGKDAGA